MAHTRLLQTVPSVDLYRYCGIWYEIASKPHWFEANCFGTIIEYTMHGDHILVEIRCNKNDINGKPAIVKGKASVVENSGNARLDVEFFWPFKEKYWIIRLANDYSYAVVCEPNCQNVWILSRTPCMETTLYQNILDHLQTIGFNLSKLVRTPQLNEVVVPINFSTERFDL